MPGNGVVLRAGRSLFLLAVSFMFAFDAEWLLWAPVEPRSVS